MVNIAARYKWNNACIGLCSSRGRSQWTFFSFYRQIDPVVSIHTYSPLIYMGAIFQEHESRSQNVVWRKKIKLKINIRRFAREHNLNDLPAGCETLSKTKGCLRVSSCVCCKVGGKKYTNNSCENMVSGGVRNWFINSPMHFQLRASWNKSTDQISQLFWCSLENILFIVV